MRRDIPATLLLAALLACPLHLAAEHAAEAATVTADGLVDSATDDASADRAGDALGAALVDGKLGRAEVREAVVKAYAAKRLTRDRVRRLLAGAYARRSLAREDLRWLLVASYRRGELTRDDVRELVFAMYREGQLRRSDVRWLVVGAYREGELTRDDVRELLGAAHRAGALTREDLRWLVVSAYRAGELTRPDLAELLGAMYKGGHLARADLRWLLISGYKAGELRSCDVRSVLGGAYRLGHLSRADLRWLLAESRKAGELEAADVQQVLSGSVSQGDLSKDDAQGLLAEAFASGELKAEEVDAAEVAAAGAAPAVDEERPFENDAALIVYLAVKAKLLELDLRAQSLIAFARERGKDVSALVERRAAFVDAVQSLEDAAHDGDMEAMKARAAEVKVAIAGFQREALSALPLSERRGIVPFTAARLAAEKGRLDELRAAVRARQAALRLAAFDRRVRLAEAVLARTRSEGIDTSAVDAKLSEVRSARSALNDAAQSADAARVRAAVQDLARKGAELKRAFERDARRALAAKYLSQAGSASAKVHGFLDAADSRGIDTKQERARLAAIDADLALARSHMEAARYPASLASLRAAGRRLSALGAAMRARALFGKGGSILAYVGKAGQPLARLKAASDALERRGVDISAERAQAQNVRELLDSASSKVRFEDYDGALDDAAKAREAFNSLRASLLAKVRAAGSAAGGG